MAPVSHVRRLTIAVLAALPAIAWPGLSHPFSTPKLWTLVATVIALPPIAWLAHRRQHHERHAPTREDEGHTRVARARVRNDHSLLASEAEGSRLRAMPRWLMWLVAAWLASWSWSAIVGDVVSLDALLLAFASALLAVIIATIAPLPRHVAMAMVIGATVVAVVAIGQWLGVDVFALAGWVPPIGTASARLRVYGTLGNPNFVAALVAATLPLTLALALSTTHLRRRRELFAAMGLQAAALMATGSRGGALGVLVAALTWSVDSSATTIRGWRRKGALFAIAGCGVALLAVAVSSARPLGDTVAGRAYIVRVAWPHAFEAPWAGRGPGAFELLYPAWDRAGIDPDRVRFGGPQQHAHNDYLEALIERGILGPVTILAILATCFWNGWRHPRAARDGPLVTGTLAMLAAVAVMACIDFPLARPTEATWFWCGVAIIALMQRRG